ncbi:MAG TPA: hypothetical protein VGO93_29505 [Candidatus Xenobia bacterium]|jgi:hypothetical protein
MKEDEKRYTEKIESALDHFGTIQRNLVRDKNGIGAIVKFIQDFAGTAPAFSLDDPVILKGKQAAFKVIDELEKQLLDLQNVKPPDIWEKFHQSLLSSIQLQLDGYKEMVRVFEDSDIAHLSEGQDMVNKGFGILEGGSRAS